MKTLCNNKGRNSERHEFIVNSKLFRDMNSTLKKVCF